MANDKFTDLPVAINANMSDIICAVQGYTAPDALGASVQQTLQQVFNLFNTNINLFYPGNPNGHVAGVAYQSCWDTLDHILYICTAAGSISTAVWTPCIGQLTDGQLRIGSTGNVPAAMTLSAGAGITITNAPGTITIEASADGSWVDQTTPGPVSMTINTGYTANNADNPLIFTLPVSANVGDFIEINGGVSASWQVAQNSGQYIRVGNAVTTTGATGYIKSTNQYDSVILRCIAADNGYSVASQQSLGLDIH